MNGERITIRARRETRKIYHETLTSWIWVLEFCDGKDGALKRAIQRTTHNSLGFITILHLHIIWKKSRLKSCKLINPSIWPLLVLLRYLRRSSAFLQRFLRVLGRIIRHSSVSVLFSYYRGVKRSAYTLNLLCPHKNVTGKFRRSGRPVYRALPPNPVIAAFSVQISTYWRFYVWARSILRENVFLFETPESWEKFSG